MKFRLGCELTYKVTPRPSLYSMWRSHVCSGTNTSRIASFRANFPRRAYTVPDLKNRYMQIVAPAGNFTLSYSAELVLNVYRADPAIVREIDVKDLPLDIFPYLLPSRFVAFR